MKRTLLAIAVCLALWGCTQPTHSSSAAVPEETQAKAALPSETHDNLQVYALPNPDTYWVLPMGDNLVLFSGSEITTLTVLSMPELSVQGSCVLDYYLSPQEPSLTVGPDFLSFYDPISGQVSLLDSAAKITRLAPVPADMTGTPVLSSTQDVLYYCTSEAVKAWDLKSGIRRTIKELDAPYKSVSGLNWNDTIVSCSVTENSRTEILLIDTVTGQQLAREPEDFTLICSDKSFYATFSAGLIPANVFGTSQDVMRSLLPEDESSHTVFLPKSEGAVSVCSAGENAYSLTYYDLKTGGQGASLSLNSSVIPAVADCGAGEILLLIRSPEAGVSSLCRWSATAKQEGFTGNYVSAYRTAEDPDLEGLAQCRSLAQQLGQKYHVEILLHKDAVAVEPWDYTLIPEHRVDVLRRELKALETHLSAYPQQLLSATAADFDVFRICLVRELLGKTGAESLPTAAGIQFFQEKDSYLALAVGEYAQRTLYHEFYHAMQTHLMVGSAALDRWEDLNPNGFAYDYDYAANAHRDSGIFLRQGQQAFIDTYSMSFPKEDQARVMEYAMLPGNEDLFACPILQKKLQTLCQAIREAYDLESSEDTFLWEQYIIPTMGSK